MDGLAESQKKIEAALLHGRIMTTAEMNKVGGTVDARKIISRLRNDKGLPIGDEWIVRLDENGKFIGRYKRYFYIKDGEKPGYREVFWNQ
jgi:hypothetical protein